MQFLRVRITPKDHFICYKKRNIDSNGKTLSVEETEVEVADGNKILDNSYCYLVIEGNLTNSRYILKGNEVTALIRSKTENIDPYITFSVEEIEYIENDFTDNLIFNEYIILERLIDMKK